MIGINGFYDTITKYLVLKGKGGYGTNAQFNDDVRRMQTMLQNYFINRYAESNVIEESLSPFITQQTITLTDYTAPKPTSFRHKISAKYQYSINNDDFSNSSLQEFPLIELRANEWDATHDSVIRGANKEKERGYYGIMSDTMRFSFNKGDVIVTYIKTPPTAVRQVTLDVATDNENYNPTGTVDLIWNESDENNLIDIMLWFKGIQIRESEIMNWVISSKQLMK
jgi:hypothetical protein